MDETVFTEKDYQISIEKAKEELDRAYTQYMDGAIMLSEFSQFPIVLAHAVSMYQIFTDLEQFKPKS